VNINASEHPQINKCEPKIDFSTPRLYVNFEHIHRPIEDNRL